MTGDEIIRFTPQTRWIRLLWNPCTPLMRREFHLERLPCRAELIVTALGLYEVSLNGHKIGDERLAPGWVDYRMRIPARRHDVGHLLCSGNNALGAILANGFYAGYWGPFEDKGFYGAEAWFACELRMEFPDGDPDIIVSTDAQWRATQGPILRADLLMGEEFDARSKCQGWNQPGYDDSSWSPVRVLDTPPEQPLVIREIPPVKEQEVIAARQLASPAPGIQVFDLGQNIVGHVRLCVALQEGEKLLIRHGEMLNPDGTVYTGNLRQARATDSFIASGDGVETWQPLFTYHGFRYIQIEGPALPDGAVHGVMLSVFEKSRALFDCGGSGIAKLMENIDWSIRGNSLVVPSDCPQRDERLGWTGEFQYAGAACYLHDWKPFAAAWLDELNLAQFPNGAYPDYAPYMGRIGGGHAAWSDQGIIVAHRLWQLCGDLEPARRHWRGMLRYMDHLAEAGEEHHGPQAALFGDWLNWNDPVTCQCLGAAYHARLACLMSELALALGEDAAASFAKDFQRLKAEFVTTFVSESGVIDTGSQCAYALAIVFELLEEPVLAKAAARLIEKLAADHNHLTTGTVGSAHLLEALSMIGRDDLAYTLLLNKDLPSWLYQIQQGATTVWERWDSWTPETGFADEAMNSFNHPVLGSVAEWLFARAAGIRPAKPGFAEIIIAPRIDSRLGRLSAAVEAPHGRISSVWRIEGDAVELEWDLPPGTTGRVLLPQASAEPIPVKSGSGRATIPLAALQRLSC